MGGNTTDACDEVPINHQDPFDFENLIKVLNYDTCPLSWAHPVKISNQRTGPIPFSILWVSHRGDFRRLARLSMSVIWD